PFRSTKPIEAFRFAPNPIERASPDIFEAQIGNGGRSGRTGERIADWIYREITLAPAVETRFRPGLVIVREHIKDVDPAGKPRFGCGCDFSRASDLFARWEQACPIKESPAVELRIGQLDSFGSQRFRQLDHLGQAIDVVAV